MPMDTLGTRREFYLRRHHGKTINFLAPGVERQSRQQRGLLYGSDNDYLESRASGRPTRLCSDQSSWERLKIRKQQQDAEDDLQSYNHAKHHAQHQMVEEKKKDMELLQKYNPWGRPAPGAPRWTPSGSLLARGDAPISRQRVNEGENESTGNEELTKYVPFGRPGGGAPLKSHDGHVNATMRVHPETRFQKHLKREVENSLRYKAAVEGQAVPPPLTRAQSVEERESQRRHQQSRYAQRLEDQMEEVLERKRRDKIDAPLSYFPWGQSSPRRDESGKLLARRRPRPPPQPEFQSIVEQIERIGKRDTPTSHCTHPFTHGSHCGLHMGRRPPLMWGEAEPGVHGEAGPERDVIPTTTGPIVKVCEVVWSLQQSYSLPASSLQREAEERQQQRRRVRGEKRKHCGMVGMSTRPLS